VRPATQVLDVVAIGEHDGGAVKGGDKLVGAEDLREGVEDAGSSASFPDLGGRQSSAE
jgi:hypothetical protein